MKILFKFIIVLGLMIPASAFAINTVATGFQVSDLNPTEVDAWSVCKIVLSTDTNTYFVPTKTSGEWSSVRNVHDQPGTAINMYDCDVPDTQCRLAYQYKIDNRMGPIRYTPWTTNSTSYSTGPYSITKTGKDDHCNGSQACGIRVGTQCTGNYGVNVTYEMRFEGVSGGVRSTGYPTLGGGISWGAWSQRQYETGDSECSSPSGCQIRMTVVDNYSGNESVTCSIGYQHRDEQSQSGWRNNNAWATVFSSGSEGENCEGAGCGLQARLYCAGPPPGQNSGSVPTSGQVDGQCGPANGQVYSGGEFGSPGPPASARCSVGSVSNYQYNDNPGGGDWTWQCLGTNGGVNDNCVAFNGDSYWNPPGDPDCGATEQGTLQQNEITFGEGVC